MLSPREFGKWSWKINHSNANNDDDDGGNNENKKDDYVNCVDDLSGRTV
jgi:hypothetical protein